MANPNISQGVLSRLKASMNWPDNPNLAVAASYLAPEGIDFAPEGQATTNLQTMTGVTQSPEPYQMIRIAVHLVRAQAFANVWKAQIELNTLLGDCTVRPDSTKMDPFYVNNTSIVGIDRMAFAGREVGFIVNLTGFWNINAALWE